MYESDDEWEEKAPAPKRRKSGGSQKCISPPLPTPVKTPSPPQVPKKYVKPWTKVIGSAVFEIYDYGNNNNNSTTNNNNVSKFDFHNNNNNNNLEKTGSENLKDNGHLTRREETNDICKSNSLTVENTRFVNNNNKSSWNGSQLQQQQRRGSCLDDYGEAADSDFSRNKISTTSSSSSSSSNSAPPRLVVESIDTYAASFSPPAESSNADNNHDDETVTSPSYLVNGKQQQQHHVHRRVSDPGQQQQVLQHRHNQYQYGSLQSSPPAPPSPVSPFLSQSPQSQPKPPATQQQQYCQNCAVLNSTCHQCAFHDNATSAWREGREICHTNKVSPIKLSLSNDGGNGWCISRDSKETMNRGGGNTEGEMKGQELGSLPLSPASMTSEGEEENNKSPSLLAGNPRNNLTLDVPSPTNQDSKGFYYSSSGGGGGGGGVSPSEDRWWRVPPKKRWLPNTADYHGQVLVTDVTYNCVTVTFMESSTEKGFFKEYTDE